MTDEQEVFLSKWGKCVIDSVEYNVLCCRQPHIEHDDLLAWGYSCPFLAAGASHA